MNRIFSHLDFVLVYLDAILIFSEDAEQHGHHLEQVLELLVTESCMLKCPNTPTSSPLSSFLALLSLLVGFM